MAGVLVLAHGLWAQRQTGELRLHVQDAVGLPLAASIQLSSPAAEVNLNVVAFQDGAYTFKALPFGHYRLTVAHSGFQTLSEDVALLSGVPVTRNIALAVAPVQTVVQVTSEPALVEAGQAGSAQIVGSKTIQNRTVNTPGRGLVDLVAAQPGWLLEANGVLHPRGSEYDTQYIVNGFPVQDNRSPAFGPNFEADDVQSMRILTAGYPAEYGKKMGGVIEVNTQRNQTSGWHGAFSVQGGSFASVGSDFSLEYVTPKMAVGVNADGFLTNRYLDPPALENYDNHASDGSFGASLDRDLSDRSRLRISVTRRETHFEVPDELLQFIAGQRQDRVSSETAGRISFQHTFTPSLVMSARGSIRDVAAQLWSNPLSTPIAPAQDRGFREYYGGADLAGHHGHHDWKIGAEASVAPIHEAFSYRITDYELAGVDFFDSDTPAQLAIAARGRDREQGAYAQDSMRFGNFTLNAGIRFDGYHLLVNDHAWSPRLAASYYLSRLKLLLRTSYDRTFDTPAIENILISGSPAVANLSDAGLYLPLHPAHGNYYQAGFSREVAKHVRVDADWYLRDIHNFGDDDLLLNTGVSFPIAFDHASIHGAEAKLEVPSWGRFSGFLSYSWMQGLGSLPIAGGLFLEDGSAALLQSHDTFAITQDQRNTASGRLNFDVTKRIWAAVSSSYGSGLPVELPDNQDLDFLVSQYGAAVVNRVNFDRGRLEPSFTVSLLAGATLFQREKRLLKVQAGIENLTDRLNLIDFAGLLSGTAVAPPRSFGIRVRTEW